MIVYVVWYLVKSRKNWLKERLLCCHCLKKNVYKPLNVVVRDNSSVPPFTRSELDVDEMHAQEEDEALFARAEVTNHFQSSPGQ